MKKYYYLSILFYVLLCFRTFANPPLPFFVAGLSSKIDSQKIRTLAQYELTEVLGFNLDPALSGHQLQLGPIMNQVYNKLARVAPNKAKQIKASSPELFENNISFLVRPISIPPGVDWQKWAHAKDEELLPLAVGFWQVGLEWQFYVQNQVFEKLSELDKAMVLWQLLWSQQLPQADNLQIRTLVNYLFSNEWNRLSVRDVWKLFKALKVDYLEESGFCFDTNSDFEFHHNGKVKKATASNLCEVSVQNQKLVLTQSVEFYSSGRLFRFSLSQLPASVLLYNWRGYQLRIRGTQSFTPIILAEDGTLLSGYLDLYSESTFLTVRTSQAHLNLAKSTKIEFWPSGEIKWLDYAVGETTIQGKKVTFEDSRVYPYPGTGVSFYENGKLECAFFPKGSVFKTDKGEILRLEHYKGLCFNPEGLVILPPTYGESGSLELD